MLSMKQIFLALCLLLSFCLFAQPDRWQQRIKYAMDVQLDVTTNIITGTQKIEYVNNSPDTLTRLFFHAYWNAFQPNSSMDVRSRVLGQTQIGNFRDGTPRMDWDARVTDRILNLKPNEIGYCKINSISVNGLAQRIVEHETVIEIPLSKALLPKSKTMISTSFSCQVPVQIRRSGRDNKEGVRYSMSQWYPKLAEYDYQGWNANPYIAREFHGVWGDFDVKLTVDKTYMLAATGLLQNANLIGMGYEAKGTKLPEQKTGTTTWNFVANNVHDFVWAADPTYVHFTRTVSKDLVLHFFYKPDGKNEVAWQKMADTCVLAYPIIAKTFGAYAYKTYSFIQGGDGGMEYPMATLIRDASVGTAIHEWMHSWFQMMMGTNESLYPWMDEGFTSYAEARVSHELKGATDFAIKNAYNGYFNLVRSNREEPMSTHSDHYNTNFAYSNAAYNKGAVFMAQLGYIVGEKNRDQILLEYYRQWRFKHPNPNDFIRVAERVSGMELDWYKEYWMNSTKTIDYKIDSLWSEGNQLNIRIGRLGKMPMPVDVELTFADGSKELHYIPLNLMYGIKPIENDNKRTVHPEWRWTHPTYDIQLSDRKLNDVVKIEIDPSQRLADLERKNNLLELNWGK
jgi:hypothetical protein